MTFVVFIVDACRIQERLAANRSIYMSRLVPALLRGFKKHWNETVNKVRVAPHTLLWLDPRASRYTCTCARATCR